ncbi:MAG: cyclase family protein [Patescibacteria group bacterium]|nr:cyclase family protein [Patescibacteria group bacterium]MDE1965773.1 cyclase family protein [Patescibacteria group bacterium]
MKIIDLSLPIYTGMPVYSGDPEAKITLIQNLAENGWNMRRLEMNGHDGTHVNAQSHAVEDGKSLDDYPLERFAGKARIYKRGTPMDSSYGYVFRDHNIEQADSDAIRKEKPRFVALAAEFEFHTEVERELLKEDFVLFERLANTKELPDEFHFYGMPLRIRDGDGSPVRAFAVVE